MNPTFSETQRFNQWWFYLILALPFLFFVVITALTYAGVVTTKNGENDLLPLLVSVTVSFLFGAWFFFIKLVTAINEDGIIAHFKGIPFCKRTILWSEIQSIDVIEYSPIFDYGGWGVRYSLTGNGWCYNVSGKKGIKLQLTNGKSFLIGTRKPEEVKEIINHYFKK